MKTFLHANTKINTHVEHTKYKYKYQANRNTTINNQYKRSRRDVTYPSIPKTHVSLNVIQDLTRSPKRAKQSVA